MEEFEASESAKKTKTIYISTVFGIAMVLLMVGLLGLILVHANRLSRYVKENIVLNIYVDEAAHESDVLQLQKQLEANPMVKQTQYVSKELAARNLRLLDLVPCRRFPRDLNGIDRGWAHEWFRNSMVKEVLE